MESGKNPGSVAVITEGLVSTIIPVYNRAGMLVEAVNSVLAQTWKEIEIILVDDGSNDETPAIMERLRMEHPEKIRVVLQENAGPGRARETGRQLARGEFVQYLDSDDLLLPTKFERLVNLLRQHPDCDGAYGITLFDEGCGPGDVPLKRTGEHIETMFPAFLESRWWSTHTPLYTRRIVDKAGPWLPLRNEEDWEYDCRIASFGTRLAYCHQPLSITRSHSAGHLCSGGSDDPVKLADRAIAHEHIYRHALKAGVRRDQPEMRYFARDLFLLARQCGAAGLAQDSRRLFLLARDASEPARRKRADFIIYDLLARLLGWTTMGRLSCYLDDLRSA